MPRERRQKDSEASDASPQVRQERKWIWYHPEQDGKPAKKEFNSLPAAGKGRLLAVVKRYLEGASRRHDIDHLGSGMYEARTQVGNDHYRVLFFHWGPDCVALTAFYKNQRKTPKVEKERAESRRTQWEGQYGKHP
ncbi:type II toxin-antitoxin system RelE/ParE family toxin [Actinoplanes auranticolor]|uniref:Phage-related protein n=1 Tax=Actinoplanes auranticolor TaxID=47988 RepID=A0A919SNG1_9ACTN|nr:hypothetical protein Aau02nite_63530 [Actinoplanes auranticolor]